MLAMAKSLHHRMHGYFEEGLGLSQVEKKVLKKYFRRKVMIKALKKCSSRKVIKKALKILLKKVNLLKKGLKKVQPVKKVNSRKYIHSKK